VLAETSVNDHCKLVLLGKPVKEKGKRKEREKTTTTTPFSRTTRYNVSILDFVDAKDDGSGGNSWNYKMCKTSVKSSPPTSQHSAFYRREE